MTYELVKLDRDGYVATITLNRPDKLNALNRQLTQEFHAVLDEVAGDFPGIRAVVLTGAGNGFCSGADVSDQAAALSRPTEPQAQTDGSGAAPTTSGIPQ